MCGQSLDEGGEKRCRRLGRITEARFTYEKALALPQESEQRFHAAAYGIKIKIVLLGCRFQFVIAGYVVMPEHIHLLIGEPKMENPSRVMQVLKQRVSLQCRKKKKAAKQHPDIFSEQLPPAFWQPRSYDFNVRTEKKYVEKLNYIHSNPVRRGLVESPEFWPWSSFRHYWLGEEGPVKAGA